MENTNARDTAVELTSHIDDIESKPVLKNVVAAALEGCGFSAEETQDAVSHVFNEGRTVQ